MHLLAPVTNQQVPRIIERPPLQRQSGTPLLAEDGGWPVKTIFKFSGEQDGQEISFQLEANVTDVNDSDIKIEAP